LPLLVYKLTGSALNLGLTTTATFLPYPLFGLVLGALVDRFDRKRVMILADLGRALVILSIPVQAFFWPLSIWWIYAVSFLHSTLTICFEAGEFAAIPTLVGQDDLVKANGRIQASYSAASIIGPLLAGLLVVFLPLPSLLFLDSFSFLLSAGFLALIVKRFNSAVAVDGAKKHLGQDVLEGLRYVLKHPVLRNISLMMAMMNFVDTIAFSQLVLFARTRLQATDFQIGLLYSAASVGIVVFSLLAGILRKRWNFSQVALGALLVIGVCTIILAWMRLYWIGLLLWGIISGLGILFNINTSSLRQAIVPNHLLGRVMSIAGVLGWSSIPLGALLGGILITWTGNIALVYALVGCIDILLPLIFAFTALGRAERYLPLPLPQEENIESLPDPSI
jgi:MFS family permease